MTAGHNLDEHYRLNQPEHSDRHRGSIHEIEQGRSTFVPEPGGDYRSHRSESYSQQQASHSLASFPLRNTSDAIRLLDQDRPSLSTEHVSNGGAHVADSSLSQFFLLQEGLIQETTLFRLVNFYLDSIHPIMPLIPYERRPKTSEHILVMASREPHFMAAILVVSAGVLAEHSLHHVLWQRVERLFAQVAIKGTVESLELLEGLLLLSEYPPAVGHSKGLRCEDRMCWMTVGTAVRLGYLLGLEQLFMQADDTDEDSMVSDRARGKVVWSHCFLLDRQISIRVGKPFWHRSPGMTIQHLHSDPADDFPQLRKIEGLQDDYAAYLQCLMQLTQVLSNAHDLLYSSKSHSFAIARAEQYYKTVDDFATALSRFRDKWHKRPWQTYPVNECVWISYHHLRLYIYSFSLHGHMVKAESCSEGRRPIDYFPTGLMGSVDARFIIEAMNAGADILRLAISRFQAPGALACLPLRFFLFFTHAGVFLLKLVTVVPLPASQKRAIFHLVRGLVKCMSTASSDPKHPATRNSSALDRLLRRIHGDHDLQTPYTATRPASPRLNGSGAIYDPSSVYTTTVQESRPSGSTALPAILGGSSEVPFIAERPLQDLAADIDAVYGLDPENLDFLTPLNVNPASDDLQNLPTSDVFASLFNYDDRDFWGSFNPMMAD